MVMDSAAKEGGWYEEAEASWFPPCELCTYAAETSDSLTLPFKGEVDSGLLYPAPFPVSQRQVLLPKTF